ncbi:scavenger receptor class B member 1-like [Pararge aegeria]|uniref:scavenger receptor class B member 1-like n=1 Tax=Pararge aegeria TaxID=116150 RepID=UPI0019D29BB9|nr:scavenger receptor class B member 1-like [Pararge aegeria]XP_039750955.1 scavenger receptor class B member 1-like [Pararge aegeria]XP_039750956.1 scavenger receptor class B member 1-like [Pararge aegeria]
MKRNANNNTKNKTVVGIKIYILIAIGFILIVIPTISVLVDTQLALIKYNTRIEKGSEIYQLLQQEIPGAFIHVYVFNVTNAEAFTSGEDHKLKVQEVGPFIYREYRRNEQFELDEEKGVMRYTPHLWTKFIPEGSVADPHSINVTVPNTALLAMASMISDYPLLKGSYNMLVNYVGSKALVNLDVHSHLWGYEEPLIRLGHTFLPGWITFSKIGILDRLYDQSTVPHMELSIKSEDKFRINTLNGARGLNVREYENPSKRSRCNTLEDTFEGIAYPPGLTTKTQLRIYRNVFCQMLNLDLVGTRTMEYGSEAFVYKLSNDTFRIGPRNECLCGEKECKNGVSDISPCLYNLPMALSQAHFFNADPTLYERIDGIHPNEEEHGSEIVVDTKIGAVLKTFLTVQVSVDIHDVRFNRAAKPFSNMLLPIAYFKIIQADIPEEDKEKLKVFYFRVFYVIRAVQIFFFFLGLVCLVCAAKKIYWSVVCSKSIGYQISRKHNTLSIIQNIEEPLMDGSGLVQKRVSESEND